MLAKDFTIQDLNRLGPIIESLLESGKLTDEQKWAVDLSGRAAFDLAQIRHSELARAFYARSDMEERSANSISEWIAANMDTKPGTVTSICGRLHVASYDANGKLNLYPILELC